MTILDDILKEIEKAVDDFAAEAPKLEGLVSNDNKVPDVLKDKVLRICFKDNNVWLASDGKMYQSRCHPDDKFNALTGINNVIAEWAIAMSEKAKEEREKKDREAKSFKIGDTVIGRAVDAASGCITKGIVVYITEADVAVIPTPNAKAIRVLNRVTCRKVSE